ncbi:MAG: hypothetical protein E7161_03770 [Firmicutes bacterium]|nr:hypothetical protein [Bacillota bacterium]
MKNVKTLYDLLNGFSKKDINEALKMLDESEIKLIQQRYGPNLSKPDQSLTLNSEQSRLFYRHLIPKLKGILLKMNKKLKTIYEYFPEHSVEEVNEAIKSLHPQARELLYFRYGEKLDKTEKNPLWTNEMTIKFHNKVIKALTSHFECKKYSVTIYDYFPGESKEKVNALLMELSFEEKYLIYLKYGRNLQSPKKSHLWNEQMGIKFDSLRRKLQRRIKKAYNLIEALSFEEDQEWQRIIFICEAKPTSETRSPIDSITIESKNYLNNSFYTTTTFQNLMSSLKKEDIKIVVLKYENNYSVEEISMLMNIPPIEVIAALRRAVLVYEMTLLKTLVEPVTEPDMSRRLVSSEQKIEE